MFQEAIAKLTAEHLRDHIRDYLDEVDGRFTGSAKVELRTPQVNTESLAGGLLVADLDKIPRYAVDCINKTLMQTNESLWTYQYEGSIAGVISAADLQSTDRMVKRHSGAVELFLKRHQFFKGIDQGDDFLVIELAFSSTNLSGSMEVETGLWVAGFSTSIYWAVSEDGPGQH